MLVELISHSPNPEKIISAAAKLCYSNKSIPDLRESITEEAAANFVKMLNEIGHESPIEHVSFTFGIEGVSRTMLAQITRHRIASFSVQSQRYVSLDDFSFITPPYIEEDEETKKLYLEAMEKSKEAYERLSKTLTEKHTKTLIANGVEAGEAAKKAKKIAIEDARFVLPGACETKMIVTMNARSLMHFFELRCCNRAQWEIKAVADDMLKLVKEVAPTLFKNCGPACVREACPEGKMTCGKAAEIRKLYREM